MYNEMYDLPIFLPQVVVRWYLFERLIFCLKLFLPESGNAKYIFNDLPRHLI